MVDGNGRAAGHSIREPRREFLVTSYMLGAPNGRNLGAPGYSHEFVARLFCPLLERWGTVRQVTGGARELEAAVDACRVRGTTPVHFSVLPFQDTHIVPHAVNIVVPAWEFPDVPNEAFNGNPRNDWPAVANRADLVLVSGPFTEQALRRAGTAAPIGIVPVPCPDAYRSLPAWDPRAVTRIDSWAYVFEPRADVGSQADEPHPRRDFRLGKACERGLKHLVGTLIGRRRRDRLSEWIKDRRHARRGQGKRPHLRGLPFPEADAVDLSGIVFTSIFAPDDGRKNWHDMLSAFLHAMGDRDDVTLVFKLITKSRKSVERVLRQYVDRGIRHRCRVVFFCDFLPDEQMLRLCTASTFYLQATKAEGNCLPLMNYLAAGRPGISPRHSSMLDYFDTHSGLVVESHPEPAAWPHDRRGRLRTSWGRIVWPSLRDQIRHGHELAATRPEEYRRLAAAARERMAAWAGSGAVQARLDDALARLFARATAVPEDRAETPAAAAGGRRAA